MNPTEMSFEERKIELIKRLFVEAADNDYLSARWAYSHALSHQFFWMASQAIEKYLKALLLLNNVSIKRFDHDIVTLFQAAQKLDKTEVFSDVIELPETSAIGRGSWHSQPIQKFLEHLGYYGSPESRYGSMGTHLNGPIIHILDRFCAELRTLIRKQNCSDKDIFELCGKAQWHSKPLLDVRAWTVCAELPLEKLYYKSYSVGHSDELRRVFSNMNLSFFDERDKDERIFGGLIFRGSPLFNHLVRWKTPKIFGLPESRFNAQQINQLKRWVFDNIKLSKDLKEILDGPVRRSKVKVEEGK
jgi:HEPN domain-containing protein